MTSPPFLSIYKFRLMYEGVIDKLMKLFYVLLTATVSARWQIKK